MTMYEFPRDALCRGMDVNDFYPLPGDKAGIARAKAVCARCPVAAKCLAFALFHGDVTDGVFGGTTGAERERLLRRTA
jgi:WhiB family redox-sensing transcriptional regulator